VVPSAICHSLVIQGASNNVTYKIAKDQVPRDFFVQNGTLDNQTHPFTPTDSLTAALSRDLGTIQATQDPIVWAVGYVIDPVVNYTDPSGVTQQRSLYYRTQYSGDESLVGIHIHE
jgi:hypothetical protein